MSKDRLLSDEGLAKMSIDEVFLHYLKVVGDGEWTLYGVPDDIIQDIKRHERLYAESVIGEDRKQQLDPDEGYCINCDFQATDGSNDCKCIYGNELRAEQRARIK